MSYTSPCFHIVMIPLYDGAALPPAAVAVAQTQMASAARVSSAPHRTSAVAGRGAGAHGKENSTRCGTRCPGHQIFVSGSPPVGGLHLITLKSGPGHLPSSVVLTGTWHGVTPTNSSSSSTAMPGGQECTLITATGGPVGGSGSGSGSGRVAQAHSASAKATRKRTANRPSRTCDRRDSGIP